MAKSIRSKRQRKLRAFKRIRYGEKELKRLNGIVELAKEEEEAAKKAADERANEMMQVEDVDAQNTTEVDVGKSEIKHKYPPWLSHYKVKKLAKIDRKVKRKQAKRLKKEEKQKNKKGKKKSK